MRAVGITGKINNRDRSKSVRRVGRVPHAGFLYAHYVIAGRDPAIS